MDILPLIVPLSMLLSMLLLFVIIHTRYKKFTSRDMVLFFRNGRLFSKGIGGAYFLLPFIDELVVLPIHVQELSMILGDPNQPVISNDQEKISIDMYMMWQINDHEKAFENFPGDAIGSLSNLEHTLALFLEAAFRNQVSQLSINEVHMQRSMLTRNVRTHMTEKLEAMGIELHELEIRYVEKLK